jgi:hypothetical protein
MNNMSFKKNYSLEHLIVEINSLLAPVEAKAREQAVSAEYPNILLLGTSRCGSTLFTQWAASLEIFAYPSNFLSRFYKAPYIGALIYEMVTNPEYQYRNEFFDIKDNLIYSSTIGKTEGFKAPHEFWYFWREFMEFPDIPFSESEFARKFDFEIFQKELTLLQKAFGKPFLCKAKIVNWYLKSMAQHTNHILYLHMHREPVDVIRSLIKTREKWTGSRGNWFAWKPREYAELIMMDHYHQVAGQVYFTEKEILSKKKYLGNAYLSFSYSEFCDSPETVYNLIINRLKEFSSFEAPEYDGPCNFIKSNKKGPHDYLISEAYSFFEKKYGELSYC